MKLKDLLNNKEFMDLLGKENDRTLAEKFNATTSMICNIRQVKGIEPVRLHLSGKAKLIGITNEQLKKDYKELGSCAKVGKKYNVSRQYISYRIGKVTDIKKEEAE